MSGFGASLVMIVLALTAWPAAAQIAPASSDLPALSEMEAVPGDPATLPRLLTALRTGNEPLRKKAAWAISETIYYKGTGEVSRDDIADGLVKAITSDPVPYVRQYCLKAAAVLKHPKTLEAVLSATRDKDPYLRQAAMEALCALAPHGHAEALKAAIAGLEDSDQQTRDWACQAIATIGGKEAQAVLLERAAALKELPFGLAQALIAMDTAEARQALLKGLQRTPVGRSASNINTMLYFAKVADKSMADDLRPFLDHRDWRVREATALYCGNAGDRKAAAKLRELVATEQIEDFGKDGNGIRLQAIKALGQLKDAEAVPVLRKYVGFQDTVEALGAIGSDEAIEAIYDGVAAGLEAPRNYYWQSSRQIGPFLRLYDAKPLKDGDLAARLLHVMLSEEALKLTEEEARKRGEDFLATLADRKGFGPEGQEKGTEWAGTGYTFYKEPFVLVTFKFYLTKVFVGSTDVLYRLTGGKYVRIGACGGSKA